jgi:hypothetical protein
MIDTIFQNWYNAIGDDIFQFLFGFFVLLSLLRALYRYWIVV